MTLKPEQDLLNAAKAALNYIEGRSSQWPDSLDVQLRAAIARADAESKPDLLSAAKLADLLADLARILAIAEEVPDDDREAALSHIREIARAAIQKK